MSNVCGLRRCWSVGLFNNIRINGEHSINDLSNSLQNVHILCNSASDVQHISTFTHDHDVEERIFLVERKNCGFDNVNLPVKKEAFAHTSTCTATVNKEIDFSQPKVEHHESALFLPKSESDKGEILQEKEEILPEKIGNGYGETTNEQSQENSICYFEILPDELALKIMSYIPLKELYVNIQLVCKTWRNFALSPILWQYLDFGDTKYLAPDFLLKIICKNCSLLKRLNLRCSDDLDDNALLTIAKTCPLLQELTVPFCGEFNSTLKIFIQHCPSLQYLNMEGCNITDDDIQEFAKLSLKGLNASHCVHLTDDALKFIVSHCSHLLSINFDGVQWITDSAVCTMVQHCHQTIEKLWLDGDNLTDSSVIAIAKCKNLRLLSISFCENFTDESLMSVQQMKKLYSLRLRKGDKFTSTGFIQMLLDLDAHLMENISGLQFVAFPECTTLEDEALKVLAESCPNLVYLDLSWCWDITDHGLRHVIVNCPRMEKMTICGLTDVQGECLIDLPKRMPNLIYVDASQCNTMSDDILYELVDTVPRLVIIDYYSEVILPGSGNRLV